MVLYFCRFFVCVETSMKTIFTLFCKNKRTLVSYLWKSINAFSFFWGGFFLEKKSEYEKQKVRPVLRKKPNTALDYSLKYLTSGRHSSRSLNEFVFLSLLSFFLSFFFCSFSASFSFFTTVARKLRKRALVLALMRTQRRFVLDNVDVTS